MRVCGSSTAGRSVLRPYDRLEQGLCELMCVAASRFFEPGGGALRTRDLALADPLLALIAAPSGLGHSSAGGHSSLEMVAGCALTGKPIKLYVSVMTYTP